MLAGIGLIAGAAPAAGAAADPAGGCSPIPAGAADVDPVEGAAEEVDGFEAGDAEEESGAALRHDGNASNAASTSK
jgi:hypothetical protein